MPLPYKLVRAQYNAPMHLSDAISSHFRLTDTQLRALRALDIHTLRDLLYHFPARYERLGAAQTSRDLVPGTHATLYGTFEKLEAKKLWKSRRTATEGWFRDGSGRVKVLWFNQPYIARMVAIGTPVKISGSISGSAEKPYVTNPEVTPLDTLPVSEGIFAADQTNAAPEGYFPVYPESQGITSRWFYHAIKRVMDRGILTACDDPIPSETLAHLNLPQLTTALVWIHTPRKESDAQAARKRFAFEEMFAIQLAKQQERLKNNAEQSLPITVETPRIEAFMRTFPFDLTSAQQRAITDIIANFSASHPMARLLEGDVGSGKTAVAAATAYAVVTSRPPGRMSGTLQVAYMAPTEILATQHFHSFVKYFKELPISIGLITGSRCLKFPSKVDRDAPTDISRAQLLKWVASGEIAMLVGTHALVQKSVTFQHLAYVIIDEQHRFGTMQRRALAHKGERAPHFLSMTATPIPRTLALTIYGDLDISVLDELPKDRAPVETTLVPADKRPAAYEHIRRALNEGRQAYVICPRIDEPDPEKETALQAKSAKAEAQRLQKDVFPEFSIGLMHGKLTPKEKETVMHAFETGKTHVLVTTSVVEVGVNVPNATIMIIEGAERFGLSQLHQLRGRIMRSHHRAYCYLFAESKGQLTRERLAALTKAKNGFELAEYDLMQRGAGELYGRKQWGISDIGMEALKNPRLIEAARTEAQNLLAHDPDMNDHTALQARVALIAESLHNE